MRRILVATDGTEGSRHAIGRAFRLARASGAQLGILQAMPEDASDEEVRSARRRIHDQVESLPGSPQGIELDLSIRLPTGNAAEEILEAAHRFRPDVIILGAHGVPRFRDVIFGTTASHVIREAKAPVLIVQNDDAIPYRKVMVAIDDEAAEEVLDHAFRIAAAEDLFVVHAFSAPGLFEDGDLLETVRTQNDVLILKVRQKARAARAASASVHVHNMVEEGDAVEVIMRTWTEVRPDLLVMGTHGRSGLARLLRGSHAEVALLGCPSDILIIRTAVAVGERG